MACDRESPDAILVQTKGEEPTVVFSGKLACLMDYSSSLTQAAMNFTVTAMTRVILTLSTATRGALVPVAGAVSVKQRQPHRHANNPLYVHAADPQAVMATSRYSRLRS